MNPIENGFVYIFLVHFLNVCCKCNQVSPITLCFPLTTVLDISYFRHFLITIHCSFYSFDNAQSTLQRKTTHLVGKCQQDTKRCPNSIRE